MSKWKWGISSKIVLYLLLLLIWQIYPVTSIKAAELNTIDSNRTEMSGRTGADQHTDQNLTDVSKYKNTTFSFHLSVFFLPFVEWGSRNVSLPATFPFLCCTGLMKAFFILTPPRWLSDALFKSVLIFSFAWLHYEEVLSTLGNKKHRE